MGEMDLGGGGGGMHACLLQFSDVIILYLLDIT